MKHIIIYLLSGFACLQFSCKKFLEIGPPKSSLVKETVFKNDGQATSAVIGIYSTMASSGNYASGDASSVTALAGLSADELLAYNSIIRAFQENELASDNSSLSHVYATQFRSVYAANSVLEGLAASNSVTPEIKAQLKGEALFVRAFTYFYLVNLYGAVPLQLSTDYRITQIMSRTPVLQIYQQILTDLKMAEVLLTDVYPTEERIRPNRSAVQALLARTYLYLEDWENAEKYSTMVISKRNIYSLVDLDAVFLANSKEAIWQLAPPANGNTLEGFLFILFGNPGEVSLRNSFVVDAFESNDKRKDSWVNSITSSAGTFYYPFKYKIKSSTEVKEYSMVLRLGEQYLIRAEARINLGKIDLGISDLNLIRERARPLPTPLIPNPLPSLELTLNKTLALLAVEQERKIELFSEWGHRWLDLKRTGKASTILSPIKSRWKYTAELYPIPYDELSRNLNIKQNPGY